MSGFKALNIESDDESDIEIDDTKEIQIEDALKLYQNALKFHAEGPQSFEKAAAAYQELFDSEIFKYPESQPELRRIELYGPAPEVDDSWDDFDAGVVVATASLDTGPSTLPQILHLSHKNYAAFKLEYLTHRLENANLTLKQILDDASAALDHFVAALDKDDTDLDLWRRVAKVGTILDSKRVARFCLEAVLESDDEGLNSVFALPGLEEGLAAEQLRDLISQLQDRLSVLQAPLPVGKRRVLSKMLKQRLNIYESITSHEKVLKEQLPPPTESNRPARIILNAPSTWTGFGQSIVDQLLREQNGSGATAPAPGIEFDLSQAVASKSPVLRKSPSPMAVENIESKINRLSLPMTISEQFPGLDGGKPTVQPRIAAADPQMQSLIDHTSSDEENLEATSTRTLPSRKRSGDAAGILESTEEVRNKSRRIRARDSTMDTAQIRQTMLDENAKWEKEQQLGEIQAADDWVFDTVGALFDRAGIIGFDAAKEIRQELCPPEDETAIEVVNPALQSLKVARADVMAFLKDFKDPMAQILLKEGKKAESLQSAQPGGSGNTTSHTSSAKPLSEALPIPDDTISELVARINNGWFKVQDAAWEWLRELIGHKPELSNSSSSSSYTKFLWPDALKTMVVRVLVNFDSSIQARATSELEKLIRASVNSTELQEPFKNIFGLAEMIETIFELHLDVHMLIQKPNSGVDEETILTQGERLQRWAGIAHEAIHFRSIVIGEQIEIDELDLRFLWATTFYFNVNPEVTQEHILECMKDLRTVFVRADEPTILLPNNAIMPELSVAALDKEVSRLTTKDFFLKITSEDLGDPVSIIESLEPLLELLDHCDGEEDNRMDEFERPADASPELVKFLQGSDMSVRLLLWKRLRDSYSEISYEPMVVSCYLRMMRIILDNIKATSASEESEQERLTSTLRNFSILQHFITKLVKLIQDLDLPFECIDEDGLKLAVEMFGEILQLLQVFNVFEDSIRVGKSQPPSLPNGLSIASWDSVATMIHETEVHTWIIVYALFKEVLSQHRETYLTPTEDQFDVLRCVHRNLGIRGICGASKRMFVRLLKDEFLQMNHVEGYDTEQAQVLYDLYGLNCFINPSYELIEHDCTHDAYLEKSVALQTVDLLLAQAAKIPFKELIKHNLKDSIERVHGVAPRKKPSEAILRNREIYRSFLRSPINPVDIYDALRGEGNELYLSYVPKSDAMLAFKGWYFLMGQLSLTKFRSQKRTAPTPTEDVDIAIAFFNQELEYSMENWETWFRLAQAYDTKIEESVVWSAEKLNNSASEVIQLQRMAIHCYIIALALAYRSADLEIETSEKMTELCTDFANRLYSSSRAPFNMQAFGLDELEKFMSGSAGITKSKPFAPLRLYTAWKLAKVLYQRALSGKPRSWMLHFSLANCLWKMHSATDEVKGQDVPPSAQQVLDHIIRAIELLPDKKDSREKREPILEPHYKLVSIVHKMVGRKDLTLEQAHETLTHTSYARSATAPQEIDEWVPYVLAILKTLRTADKSHWHHRMIARSAQILYDESEDSPALANAGAWGAKHELTQQMFTKSMILQVWRPECERAGRHFVYYARYIRFFVQILEQLNDRPSLDMLARRVRRRPHDVFEHSAVWQDLCSAYLRLLRGAGPIPEGLETSTFSNIAHEEFLERREPLEKWMQAQATGENAALDVLREVQELKKVNQSLMKPGPIDDLIGDSYALLFTTVGKSLWDEDRRVKQEEEARNPPPPPPPPPAVASPPRNPMMSLNHLMNVDGSEDSKPPVAPTPTAAAAAEPVAPAPRKKIGVGRREIRNSAEACAQKASTGAPSNKALAAVSGTRVDVVISRSRGEAVGDISMDSSAPGSIHDSADDESELSELEEEDEDGDDGEGDEGERGLKEESASRTVMFPGLASSEGAGSREGSPGFETADEGEATLPLAEAGDVEMGEDEDEDNDEGEEETVAPVDAEDPAANEAQADKESAAE